MTGSIEPRRWAPNRLFMEEAAKFGQHRLTDDYREMEVDYKASLAAVVRRGLARDALATPGLAQRVSDLVSGKTDLDLLGLMPDERELTRRWPPKQALLNLLGGGQGAVVQTGSLAAWVESTDDATTSTVIGDLLYGEEPLADRFDHFLVTVDAAYEDLFARGLLKTKAAPSIQAQVPAILLALNDAQQYGLYRSELYRLSAEAFGYELDLSGTAGERYVALTEMLRVFRSGLADVGVAVDDLLEVHNWLWIRAKGGVRDRWVTADFEGLRDDRPQDRVHIAAVEEKLRIIGRAVRDELRRRSAREFRYKILGLYPPGRTSWSWLNASNYEPSFGSQPTACPQINVEAGAQGLDVFFLFDLTADRNDAQRQVRERIRGRRWEPADLDRPLTAGYTETQEDPRGRYMLRRRFPPDVATDWAGLGVDELLAEVDLLWPFYDAVTSISRPRGEPELKPPVDNATPDPMFADIADALDDKGQAILYGPPGTGKTYVARRFAVWWLTKESGGDADSILRDPARFEQAERALTRAQRQRRVWWVVASPTEWSWDQLFADGSVDYRHGRLRRNYEQIEPGDLVVGYEANPTKRIVALARIALGLHTTDDGPRITLEPIQRVANGLSYEELLADPLLATSEPMRFRNQGTLFRLTATEAEGLLARLQERDPSVNSIETDDPTDSIGPLTRLTFHPSYTYEEFVEGFKPVPSGNGQLNLELTSGVFRQVCEAARAHPDQPYLVLIDEINRANLPKVFGELITVLELDKRGLETLLPQSREAFSIPRNLRLLGTMNTADRSIKLLDAAIRRRFAFIELMPDARVLEGASIGDLDLDRFLEALNRRIIKREGREKQIGHSYFLDRDGRPIATAAAFAARFRRDILPLLQEYAYDDYRELGRYLGKDLIDAETHRLVADRIADPDALVAALAEEYREEVEPGV